MYIEKNVMDNIFGTILDMKGKTKDNLEARKDLQKMGLKRTLHPFIVENEKNLYACKDLQKTGLRRTLHPLAAKNDNLYMPITCYTMSNKDKTNFFLKCFEM
jgi:hypothetical protein